MFEGLKKKFSDLVGSIVKKEETKAEEAPKQEEKVVEQKPQAVERTVPKPQQDFPKREQEVDLPKQEKEIDLPAPKPQDKNLEPVVQKEELPAVEKEELPTEVKKKTVVKEERIQTQPKQEPKGLLDEKPKLSIFSKIKGAIIGKVTIKEQDVDELLENFKLSLVEADVNYEVAERIVDSIKSKLIGSEVETNKITPYIKMTVRQALFDILDKGSSLDLLKLVQEKKTAGQLPFRILFIGPNGAGKTTTMAKIANMFLSNGLSCVLSASDTFRAAAIEQTVYHAEKLGIKAVKGTYGADPASVGFDAIEYAKAHRIDVVLIDSAGRQDTNKSLMDEMRKMVRVTAPDMKIFIGESTTGSAITDQVREFNNAIKLDGIVLTKLDCDAKGGNTISILGSSPVPILYFGLGEKYTDLMRYSPDFIIGNIIPSEA